MDCQPPDKDLRYGYIIFAALPDPALPYLNHINGINALESSFEMLPGAPLSIASDCYAFFNPSLVNAFFNFIQLLYLDINENLLKKQAIRATISAFLHPYTFYKPAVDRL